MSRGSLYLKQILLSFVCSREWPVLTFSNFFLLSKGFFVSPGNQLSLRSPHMSSPR